MFATYIIKGKEYTFRPFREGASYIVTNEYYFYMQVDNRVIGPFDDFDEMKRYHTKHFAQNKPDKPKNERPPKVHDDTPTVVRTEKFDGYVIDTFSNGTYGYRMNSGESKTGYKSKDGAKKAATKLAAKEPKGPQILKSEDKGGYTINTFSDGTYGYVMPDGTSKTGYKSKDGATKAAKKLAAKAAKPQDDAQAKLLEKQARELQVKLQGVYADAVAEMTARIEASFKQFTLDNARWVADVASGKKDETAYKAWLRDRALYDDRLKALKSALARDLTATDKIAMAHVRNAPIGVYAEGMNFATYEIERGAKINTSFTLYDKNTVMELVANEPGLLPRASFDKAKDLAWNRRHVNSAVTQAVLQGQTIPQLAASLAGIAAMDQRAAMRAARTSMTSAHSLGKLKGYERAAAMGIGVKKQWLAALDQRTRGSHRHLDGETVKLDEKFSNGLRYPGDPDGPGSEVYNCRCTMVPVIDDVPYEKVDRASKLGDMSYEEWHGVHVPPVQDKPPVVIDKVVDDKPPVVIDKPLVVIDKVVDDEPPAEPLAGVAKTVNAEFAQGMVETFDKYADETTATMYYAYGDRLKCRNKNYKRGAHFSQSASGGGIYFNYKSAMKGTSYQAPYEVAMHEFGHQIDFVGAKGLRAPKSTKYGVVNRYLSVIYGKGALDKAMREDWEDLIARSSTKTVSGVISELKSKYSVDGKVNLRAVGGLSDAFEYLSGIDYPLGVGHGSKYYVSDPQNGAIECFANFAAALASNPEALDAIEKTMPKSLGVVKEIMEHAITRMRDGKV